MTLLDTDVLVDIQEGHPPAIVWMRQLTLADFAVPGAAVLELLAGSRNGNELQKSSDFVSRLQVAWLAEADNELAAQLVERHRLSTGLSIADFLIAAQALNSKATLYTFNLKHFSAIPGLDAQAPYLR